MLTSKTRSLPITPGHRRLSHRTSHAGTTSRRSKDTTVNLADPDATPFHELIGPLGELATQFETLQDNFDMLKDVNDSLVGFNNAFSAFLFGLSTNGECVDWPEAPLIESFERHRSTHDYALPIIPQVPLDFQNPSGETSIYSTHHDTTVHDDFEEIDTVMVNVPTPKRKPPRMMKKFTGKVPINKIIEGLPLKYREQQPFRENMETILRALKMHVEGMNQPDLAEKTKIPKHRCTDCLNTLVHSKDVVKVSQQGRLVIYRLDPVKYPSGLVSV